MANILSQFCDQFQKLYPNVVAIADLNARVAPLVSTQKVQLPVKVIQDVEAAAKALFKFSRTPEQIARVREYIIATETPDVAKKQIEVLDHPARNLSILMAYDFHYDSATGQLSLIEVNTNASGFLLADLMYRADGAPWNCTKKDPRSSLLEAIAKEWASFKETSADFREGQTALVGMPSSIAIVDEEPSQQKMFLEFLMYDSFFRQNGIKSEIFDISKIPSGGFDFIYNRFNDFTFVEERSSALRSMYLEGKACFSPQPREYLLLAHKQRLVEFGEANVSPTLIPIIDVTKANPEELWAKRKTLFFKPKALYGAKAVYRGSSISHTTFDKIVRQDYIAQEFRPPGMIGEFKYDLRFYAYGDEIHLGIARAYQGQVTNFATPGGGFAPLAFG